MNDAKRKLVPALAALGGSLAAGPATALEIGGIDVQSTLGEPLRASIAYALGPNEALAEYCVALRSAPGAAIPAISRATITVDKGLITIAGSTALREPLATLRLDISCPYTPKLSREYMLMIDPGSRQSALDVEPATALELTPPAAAGATVATAAATTERAPAAREGETALPPLEALATGDRVFVEPGRTLSRIVAAVEGRAVDYAEAADRIVAANPAAFVDGDPDQLEAGNWLTIPDLGIVAPVAARASGPAAEPAQPTSTVVDTTPAAATAEAGDAAAEPGTFAGTPSPADEPLETETPDTAPPAAETLAMPAPNAGLIDDTEYLEPPSPPATAEAGDGNPAAVDTIPESSATDEAGITAASGERPASRARQVAGTTIAAPPPAQPVRRERDGSNGTSTFWYWLIGGGGAVIAGLLALLYRSRRPDGQAPAERAEPRPNPLLERVKQAEGIEVEPIQAFTAPDFNLADDSPTAENPTLDTGSAAGGGFDDDGNLGADLQPEGDQHAHEDVDINLAAVSYADGGGQDRDAARAEHEPTPDRSDTDNDAVDVDLSAGRTVEHDDDVDVDFSSGSGFDAGDHARMDEDFTFAATTALDFELPEESESTAPQPATDIIPPLNIEESSILKSEVLPEDDDDDYDMSVILDATKQPDPREVTEKDLHAVVVDAGDSTLNSGDYTIARDPEFELLEQDYEEELSATQALNMEIERAALELAGRIDDPRADAEEGPTEIASLDDDPEAQLTEELPAQVASMHDKADPATDVAAPDEDDEPPTDVARLDEETMDRALSASDDDAPTAIAPLDDDEGLPTAILDDETVDAALAATAGEEPTAIAPLDDDGEPETDVSPLDQTSIETQLAHLPGEGSAEAANDDALLDDDADPTGINAALMSEISEEDKTVEMARDDDEATIRPTSSEENDADATGINAALASEVAEEDKTVEIPREDEEPTVSLSRDADDDTVEMPPRSKNA